MFKSIKYSVVTAVYNSDRYLNSFFKSIAIQKILPKEILLIDDTKNYLLKKKSAIFQKKYKVKVKIIKNKKI